jgi:hypothetical protein
VYIQGGKGGEGMGREERGREGGREEGKKEGRWIVRS